MPNAYQVVRDFENEIARWSGSKYAVAVESCCAAIFLCLKYYNSPQTLLCPKNTYPGVPMAIINAGYSVEFTNEPWSDYYNLSPLPIVDSAIYFKKGMYRPETLWCLSFHYKKLLPIGRGGMILTDDKDAVEWLKMARFDGRKEKPLSDDNASIIGHNMYLTPEQAARGLCLFNAIKDREMSLRVEDQGYPDLTKWRCFNG